MIHIYIFFSRLACFTYLPTCLLAYLPTCLLAYLPTCLLAYLPTCLHGDSLARTEAKLGTIVRELLLLFIVLPCRVIGRREYRWISPVTSVSATVPVLRQTAWVWLH
ncbi:hypothetical protein EBA33_12310 [Escherichia coli]|nr:hypothetical protein [Escherichia coli]EFN8631849.1 hypothetical protein [Escherichia coli]